MANGDQDMATDKLMETEGMKVIAVDDDPVYLRILTQTLRRCGYEVTASCASPADALKEVEKNPDGVDFIMTVALTRGRGMDGFGLLKRIGERYPVVIMFSGEESIETRTRGTQGGACYLVEKPMCTWQIYIIWQHVLRWRREKAGGVVTANANPRPSQGVHLEDTPRKRGPGVNDSGKGKRASDGGLQPGTKATKKKKFEWTPEMHELFVNAVTQLKQTGGA